MRRFCAVSRLFSLPSRGHLNSKNTSLNQASFGSRSRSRFRLQCMEVSFDPFFLPPVSVRVSSGRRTNFFLPSFFLFLPSTGLSPDLQSMEQIKKISRPTDVPETGEPFNSTSLIPSFLSFLKLISLLLLLSWFRITRSSLRSPLVGSRQGYRRMGRERSRSLVHFRSRRGRAFLAATRFGEFLPERTLFPVSHISKTND